MNISSQIQEADFPVNVNWISKKINQLQNEYKKALFPQSLKAEINEYFSNTRDMDFLGKVMAVEVMNEKFSDRYKIGMRGNSLIIRLPEQREVEVSESIDI